MYVQNRLLLGMIPSMLLASPSPLLAAAAPQNPPDGIASVDDDAEPPFRDSGPARKKPAKTTAAALTPETPPSPSTPAPAASEEPSRFHLSIGADYTTKYYFRGIRQEDSGFIIQPFADAALDLVRSDAATLSAKIGVWNSFHGEATGATTGDSFVKHWYECDLYAGLGFTVGKWALDARYYFYTSPSDAFGTVEEFDFGASFDDSEYLGAWSLKPSVVLAVETGSNAADGATNGTYLQLGISPGFTFDADPFKGIAVSFPVTLGLSLSNYYEADDDNDAFGYVSVAAKVSIPLGEGGSWGAWALNASVQGLFLGDAAESISGGDDAEFIATVGVSVSF